MYQTDNYNIPRFTDYHVLTKFNKFIKPTISRQSSTTREVLSKTTLATENTIADP